MTEFPCNKCNMPDGESNRVPTYYREKHEEPTIKDSGTRRQFESGAVRDSAEGRGRCDLLPLDTISELLEYADEDNEMCGMRVLDYLDMFTYGDGWDMSFRHFLYEALIRFADENSWDVPTMLLEVSKHFEDGAKKYGERNWQKGIPLHCYIDSAVRHYLKWYRGDTDERHDRAFCWNCLCAAWTMVQRPKCNDLWGTADGNG